MSKRSGFKEDVLHKTKFSNHTEYHPLTVHLQSKLPSLLSGFTTLYHDFLKGQPETYWVIF